MAAPDDSEERHPAESATVYYRILATSATGLLVLGLVYTLYFASDFILPVATALVLNLILMPIVRVSRRRANMPEGVTAALILFLLIGGICAGAYGLAGPITYWREQLPYIGREVAYKLEQARVPFEEMREIAKRVAEATSVEDEEDKENEVVVREPGLVESFVNRAPGAAYNMVMTLVLLFFLLASGEMFREKLIEVMPRFGDKRRTAIITRQIETDISRYLFTITVINAGLGAVIGLGLWAIGLPNPILWGVMAALLNFVPYLGLLVGLGVVTLAAMVTFDTAQQALLAPAVYAVANMLEAQLVTPAMLGRRLTMNPVAVFLSLAFWTWIWGPVGAVLAVPILVVIKTVCDNVEPLAPGAIFLGGRNVRAEPKAENDAVPAPVD